MTTPCDATLTLHETATQGPLTFELWVAKELCLQPRIETTTLSETPLVVRVRNTGPRPVQMVAAVPDAIAVTRVWDADQPAAPVELSQGPEPEEVPTTTVKIAPNAAWDSAPLTGYLSFLAPDILQGTQIASGTELDPKAKLQRIFGMEVRFAATANTGAGFVPVQQTLKGSIIALLLPYAK